MRSHKWGSAAASPPYGAVSNSVSRLMRLKPHMVIISPHTRVGLRMRPVLREFGTIVRLAFPEGHQGVHDLHVRLIAQEGHNGFDVCRPHDVLESANGGHKEAESGMLWGSRCNHILNGGEQLGASIRVLLDQLGEVGGRANG